MLDVKDCTPEEQKAIKALHRLASKWPRSLWIFCNGDMVILKSVNGERDYANGSINADRIVGKSVNIPNDGGDY